MTAQDRKYNQLPRPGVINFDDDDETPRWQPQAPAASPVTEETADASPAFDFISLGSGSSGNCAYLGVPGSGGILIDAGVDPEVVFAALRRHGVTPEMIRGIVLTHDHKDHVSYAYTIVRKNKHIPIYCTMRLLKGWLRRSRVSRRVQDYVKPIYKETPFTVAGMTVTAFETSHDGSDNMGFSITRDGRTFVVATDMGRITPRAEHYMSQAHFLMIESDYDIHMLESGRYPEMLKHRIRGEQGHLDNEASARFVVDHYHAELRYVWLCHLSAENNTPELAVQTMTTALTARGLTVGDGSNAPEQRDRDVQVYALPRFEPSTFFVVN